MVENFDILHTCSWAHNLCISQQADDGIVSSVMLTTPATLGLGMHMLLFPSELSSPHLKGGMDSHGVCRCRDHR